MLKGIRRAFPHPSNLAVISNAERNLLNSSINSQLPLVGRHPKAVVILTCSAAESYEVNLFQDPAPTISASSLPFLKYPALSPPRGEMPLAGRKEFLIFTLFFLRLEESHKKNRVRVARLLSIYSAEKNCFPLSSLTRKSVKDVPTSI